MTTGSTLPTSPEPSQAAAARLSAMLIGGGAAHLLAPRWFDSLIPSQLPGSPRMYTVGSSLANLAVGAGLAIPRTRRPASVAAALLFVGYMPAKLKLTIDWWHNERTPVPAKILGIVQLFWQVPLVTESLKALRNAPRPDPRCVSLYVGGDWPPRTGKWATPLRASGTGSVGPVGRHPARRRGCPRR
jgi:uncharacterized membrane protein